MLIFLRWSIKLKSKLSHVNRTVYDLGCNFAWLCFLYLAQISNNYIVFNFISVMLTVL